MDKTLLEMYFNCLVVQPEELLEGVRTVLTHTRDEGGFPISIDQFFYEIINGPEWTQGAKSDLDRYRHIFILEDNTMCVKNSRQVLRE